MADFTRRLPVYLLLDTSGSMYGDPIEAVNQGVKLLVNELKGDPQALETAYLSVITFSSGATQVIPLTELMQFNPPTLSAGGATSLGGALLLLMERIKDEVRKSTEQQKGDWRPLVFIMTDGALTDPADFDQAAAEIKGAKIANIIACMCGANNDTAPLKRITESVLMMNSVTPGEIAKFFQWVSGSIKLSSKSLDAKPGAAIDLPPPPTGFTIVP